MKLASYTPDEAREQFEAVDRREATLRELERKNPTYAAQARKRDAARRREATICLVLNKAGVQVAPFVIRQPEARPAARRPSSRRPRAGSSPSRSDDDPHEQPHVVQPSDGGGRS